MAAPDTLRRFSHLFSLKVGAGQLIVCSFNLSQPENPVTASFLQLLVDNTEVLRADSGLSAEGIQGMACKDQRRGHPQGGCYEPLLGNRQQAR